MPLFALRPYIILENKGLHFGHFPRVAMNKTVLVSGSSNPDLVADIASHLDIQRIDPQVKSFANGEIYCEIKETVRGASVFVVQSTCPPVNDNLVELLVILDALKRASALSVTAIMPHYGYSRQDRKVHPRTPISAKLVADLLTVAGASKVITMDLHSEQIQGFFNIPFDNIYSSPVILGHIKENLLTPNTVCVAPDSGGIERVRHYAKKLQCGLAIIDKRRTGPNVAQAMYIIGDVENKDVILIDDMIDTAGTLIQGVKALKKHGANKVYSCATHAIFSDPAIERILSCDDLDGVIATDTIPLCEKAKRSSKVVILSTAKIFADVINRTSTNASISSLFI